MRTALVTGASRGIGRAIALDLARNGHRVACWASSDGGKDTQAEIEASGGEALALQADVGDAAAVDAAFGEVEQAWGPVEVLVNNAGVSADGLIARMTDDQWASVIRTNLDGAFHTIRRASPKMMKGRWGRIVNVSSVSGHAGRLARPTIRPPKPVCWACPGPSPGSSRPATSPATSWHRGLS